MTLLDAYLNHSNKTIADIGILHELSKTPAYYDLTRNLKRSGLVLLNHFHLAKIMEAAVLTSADRSHALILTGLEMHSSVDDITQGVEYFVHTFWIDLREFSALHEHFLSAVESENGEEGEGKTIREKILTCKNESKKTHFLRNELVSFLSMLLGFEKDHFEGSNRLAEYGVDSLSGIGCQYWLFKGL